MIVIAIIFSQFKFSLIRHFLNYTSTSFMISLSIGYQVLRLNSGVLSPYLHHSIGPLKPISFSSNQFYYESMYFRIEFQYIYFLYQDLLISNLEKLILENMWQINLLLFEMAKFRLNETQILVIAYYFINLAMMHIKLPRKLKIPNFIKKYQFKFINI